GDREVEWVLVGVIRREADLTRLDAPARGIEAYRERVGPAGGARGREPPPGVEGGGQNHPRGGQRRVAIVLDREGALRRRAELRHSAEVAEIEGVRRGISIGNIEEVTD